MIVSKNKAGVNMGRKSFLGYRIFLGVILVIVVGVAIWYGILSYGQKAELEDATLVRIEQGYPEV